MLEVLLFLMPLIAIVHLLLSAQIEHSAPNSTFKHTTMVLTHLIDRDSYVTAIFVFHTISDSYLLICSLFRILEWHPRIQVHLWPLVHDILQGWDKSNHNTIQSSTLQCPDLLYFQPGRRSSMQWESFSRLKPYFHYCRHYV